jgi:ATP-dependent Clp protease ATP-binding subunit ClpC
MFERFTERARQVVVLAQDEARLLRHDYIGTEHILLGLIREEDGLAARVIDFLGLTLEGVRTEVVRRVGEGGEHATTGQIPFTPHAKQTLELALREALALGHKYIGTEHVLLGLVAIDESLGVEILKRFGATPVVVRDSVIRMLSGPGRVSTVSTMVEPVPVPRGRRAVPPTKLLVTGWLLFAVALGIGVLVGWAIWG